MSVERDKKTGVLCLHADRLEGMAILGALGSWPVPQEVTPDRRRALEGVMMFAAIAWQEGRATMIAVESETLGHVCTALSAYYRQVLALPELEISQEVDDGIRLVDVAQVAGSLAADAVMVLDNVDTGIPPNAASLLPPEESA